MTTNRKGMTLIEMIVVVALVAVMTGVIGVYMVPMMKQSSQATAQKRYDQVASNVLSVLTTQIRYAQDVRVTTASPDSDEYYRIDNLSSANGQSIMLYRPQGNIELFDADYFGDLLPAITYTLNDSWGLTIKITLRENGSLVYEQTSYLTLPNMKLKGNVSTAASSTVIWFLS